MDDLLKNPNFWQVTAIGIGAVVTAFGSLFAFFFHAHREQERTYHERLEKKEETIEQFREKERSDFAEITGLRRKIVEIEESTSDHIRSKVREVAIYSLEILEELNSYISQLESELREKTDQAHTIKVSGDENPYPFYLLAAELKVRTELIAKMNSDLENLKSGIKSNTIIEEKLDTAILDKSKPARLIAKHKARMADLKVEAMAKARKDQYEANQTAKGQRERAQLAAASARAAVRAAAETTSRMALKRPFED